MHVTYFQNGVVVEGYLFVRQSVIHIVCVMCLVSCIILSPHFCGHIQKGPDSIAQAKTEHPSLHHCRWILEFMPLHSPSLPLSAFRRILDFAVLERSFCHFILPVFTNDHLVVLCISKRTCYGQTATEASGEPREESRAYAPECGEKSQESGSHRSNDLAKRGVRHEQRRALLLGKLEISS